MNRFLLIFVVVSAFLACGSQGIIQPTPTTAPIKRENLIPSNQVKIVLETDLYPPGSVTNEYGEPVPLPYPFNTAGAEDSAYIMPDGNTLYAWFTPNVKKSPEEQVTDGVTGIYVFRKVNDGWSPVEQVVFKIRANCHWIAASLF
jgi:hypothetical protein